MKKTAVVLLALAVMLFGTAGLADFEPGWDSQQAWDGIWKLRTQMDNFGIPMEDYFIVSNNIPAARGDGETAGSGVEAELFMKENLDNRAEYMVIRLVKGGLNYADPLLADEVVYDIRVTDAAGQQSVVRGVIPSRTHDILIEAEQDVEALKNALMPGGRVDFVLHLDGAPAFQFAIEAADDFDIAYKEWVKLKGWANMGWFEP